jgi:hypothetical protein
MRTPFVLIAMILALVVSGSSASAGKDAGDYLTEGGQLKEVLEVKDVQGGFAGFTGSLWKVEKDGQWKKFQVLNQKLSEKEMGKLSKDQLSQLAKELAKYNLLGLAKEGKQIVNPHVVTIQFGKHKAELTAMGGTIPKTDPATVGGRYAGILETVKTTLKAPDGKDK